jgi:hypothetical protein
VSEFGGNDVQTIDASILFCKLCECKVNSVKKFNVIQHLKAKKQLHINDVIIEGKTRIHTTRRTTYKFFEIINRRWSF